MSAPGKRGGDEASPMPTGEERINLWPRLVVVALGFALLVGVGVVTVLLPELSDDAGADEGAAGETRTPGEGSEEGAARQAP